MFIFNLFVIGFVLDNLSKLVDPFGQMSEDRGQITDDRGQKTEGRRRKSEDSVEIKIKRISNSKIQMLQTRFNRSFGWAFRPVPSAFPIKHKLAYLMRKSGIFLPAKSVSGCETRNKKISFFWPIAR